MDPSSILGAFVNSHSTVVLDTSAKLLFMFFVPPMSQTQIFACVSLGVLMSRDVVKVGCSLLVILNFYVCGKLTEDGVFSNFNDTCIYDGHNGCCYMTSQGRGHSVSILN